MSPSAIDGTVLSALDFRFTMSIDVDHDLAPLFASFSDVAGGRGEARRDPVGIELQQGADGFFELRIDERTAFRTLDLGVLVHQTVWEITRRGVEACTDRVVLHAAAVRVDDVDVLISGRSGAGKSTMTARMVSDGAVYLTDEAVAIEPGGRIGATVRRPIHLNRDSLEMLGLEPRALVRLPDGSGYLPAPGDTPGRADDGRGVAIVLLQDLSGDLVVQQPRRSELAVALIRESFDRAATTQLGLEIVKELSSRANCVAVSGGTVPDRAKAAEIVAQSANEIAPAPRGAYDRSSGQL